MASKKISELDSASALDGTETIPLVQGGRTLRALISAIKTYLNGVSSTWTAAQTFNSTVTINSNSAATLIENSFTGTLTGFATANPQGTVKYLIIANAAGTGKEVHLWIDSAISGTSNANTMTLTGLPPALLPSVDRYAEGLTFAVDNSINVTVRVNISTAGVITFSTGAGFSNTGFTNSGTKALQAGWSISYPL